MSDEAGTRVGRRETLKALFGTGALLPYLGKGPQAEPAPKADVILDRFIEVTGGRAAYDKVRGLSSHGQVVSNLGGVRGTLSAWEAEPGLSVSILEIAGGEVVKDGTIGGIAWEWSSSGVARLKEGEQKAAALRDATVRSPLLWREHFTKVETAGTETVAGSPAFKVVLTPKDGKPGTRYYDCKSGLLVRSLIMLDTPGGEVLSENDYGDYRPVCGILLPHSLLHRVKSEEVRVTLTRVECSSTIPRQQFDPPEAVRALIRKSGLQRP